MFPVVLAILNAIYNYIKNYREKPRKDHEKALFLNEGRRISRTKIHNLHKEYKYRAGLDPDFKFHPHLWRTTGITHYARLEKDIKILMKQTRHKDANVLMGYIQLAESEYKDSYESAFGKSEITEKPKPKPRSNVEPSVKPPEPTQQPTINKVDLKTQLVQKLARGEISQEVYLLALKSMEEGNNESPNYYG